MHTQNVSLSYIPCVLAFRIFTKNMDSAWLNKHTRWNIEECRKCPIAEIDMAFASVENYSSNCLAISQQYNSQLKTDCTRIAIPFTRLYGYVGL